MLPTFSAGNCSLRVVEAATAPSDRRILSMTTGQVVSREVLLESLLSLGSIEDTSTVPRTR